MKLFRGVAGALLLTLLVLPSVSFAQTMTVVQAQLQSLFVKLQSLRQQLAVLQGGGSPAASMPSAVPPSWCHSFVSNMGVGSTGPDVESLQTSLAKDGEVVNVNGSFDEKTASLVTAFQLKYANDVLIPQGLQYGTGYVGPATRAKLNTLVGCTNTSPYVPTVAGVNQPTLSAFWYQAPNDEILPYKNFVPGRSYDISINVSGAAANSPVLFSLQKPDGSMKFDGNALAPTEDPAMFRFADLTADAAWLEKTDDKGKWATGSSRWTVPAAANLGTWTGWVSVNGVMSNKVSFSVAAASVPPFPSIGTSAVSVPVTDHPYIDLENLTSGQIISLPFLLKFKTNIVDVDRGGSKPMPEFALGFVGDVQPTHGAFFDSSAILNDPNWSANISNGNSYEGSITLTYAGGLPVPSLPLQTNIVVFDQRTGGENSQPTHVLTVPVTVTSVGSN